MTDKRDIQISKALSYLLRHGAEKEKLIIDPQGYVSLSQILSNNRIKTHKTTKEDIERIVAENNKKRFNLLVKDDGQTYICANQGHSLKSITNDNLKLISNDDEWPKDLIHGTTLKNLKLILESGGLSKMNRNHIHLTSHLELDPEDGTKTITGIRSFSTVLIYLDIEKLKKNNDQIKVYKSLNNVYLSEGDSNGFISKDYFLKIIDRKTLQNIEI
ncbi:putative RNA 2'-phosphotransferase [Wickerhamomyces ciferrii]|uniref:2'-phosphotransferase n=1 Tax=Wickerhamomyces ciferrii (strain ATCC 14091 / BCRC 22168 / CBS 111 / JCM 3599 / NBRC 0793 / NRRL Y-1031 F-60-10) TaxID=1206466 RepID=K0KCB5_WICCF|nr:putative RNA 2'-phosphotransferase [Wickerhamomyces ciferrii]CCH42720.1 putative RNA 2'-phosphotransferase [Wickerhamomyces ciferrii]